MTRLTLIAALFLGCFMNVSASRAQTLTGTTALVLIPTAEMPPDGSLTASSGVIHRKHLRYQEGSHHMAPFGGSLQFLPDLELGLRFSPLLSAGRQALGDRMVIARLRLLRESPRRPALVVGAHDFLVSSESQTNNFSALYAVSSYHSRVNRVTVGFHLGYGTRWLKARAREYVGFFGGLSVTPVRRVDLLLEYDTATVNAGIRTSLLHPVHLLLALQGMDSVSGGASLRLKMY